MEQKDIDSLLGQVSQKAAESIKSELTTRDTKIAELETKSAKVESLEAAMRAQGEEITNLKAANATPKDMSTGGQIKAWQEANKESLDKIKAGHKGVTLEPLQLKVAGTMMLSTTALSPVAYYAAQGAEVNDLIRKQPTFWDTIAKGRTNLPAFPWINKTNKQGNAAFIGEGVLKPLASFDLVTETSVPKKVAERMKMSTEILYDIPSFETLVRQELEYEVKTAANAAVLTGVSSSTNPAGILTLAPLYTLTGVTTKNPTNADAIRAAIAQLNSLGNTGPYTIFLNPVDAANMEMEKAVTAGVYQDPGFATDGYKTIAGARVIEDNGIPVGKFLVGDMSKYKIMMYQDFHVEFGWENDDFSKNLVTAIGEMRFHQFMSANNVTAFVADTFANVKTAITAV